MGGRRTFRYGVSLVLALAVSTGTVAQIVGDAAGPRLGTVYEVHLAPADHGTLQDLNRRGFNIGHVTPDYAEVYTTPDEYALLVREGYRVSIVATQPNPPSYPARTTRALGVYHSYPELTTELQLAAANFPAITKLVSLGPSVQGRQLWALLITDNPGVEEDEPEFKYVAAMHGNEPVGLELCLYLIDHLLPNYGSDSRVTNLVNDTAIWIVPSMNPDGLALGTRNNANGFDLNRSFPKFPADYSGTVYSKPANLFGLQPEVQHLMQWSLENSFVLAANFHTGALVVSYPYDADPGIPSGTPAPTPDDALYQSLSTQYASQNPPMSANSSPPFVNGIVNGNDWFIVEGGMLDWMYRFLGNTEVTVEHSLIKTPFESQLPQLWNDNRESLLSYMERVHRGVRGIVTDADTGAPLFAQVKVVGNPQAIVTDRDLGDYHRLVLPGTYDLLFESWGYGSVLVQGVTVGSGAATRVDVQMTSNIVEGPRTSFLWTAVALIALIATVSTRWAARSRT